MFSAQKKRKKTSKGKNVSYMTRDKNSDSLNVSTSAVIVVGMQTTSPMSVSSSILGSWKKDKIRKRARSEDRTQEGGRACPWKEISESGNQLQM